MELPRAIGSAIARDSDRHSELSEVSFSRLGGADPCAIERCLTGRRAPRAKDAVRGKHEPAGDCEEIDPVEKRARATCAKLPCADLGLANEVGSVAAEHVVQVVLCDHPLSRGWVRNGDGERASGELVRVSGVPGFVEPVLVEEGVESCVDGE
jgi:hypothetical protein